MGAVQAQKTSSAGLLSLPEPDDDKCGSLGVAECGSIGGP